MNIQSLKRTEVAATLITVAINYCSSWNRYSINLFFRCYETKSFESFRPIESIIFYFLHGSDYLAHGADC